MGVNLAGYQYLVGSRGPVYLDLDLCLDFFFLSVSDSISTSESGRGGILSENNMSTYLSGLSAHSLPGRLVN